MMIADVAEYPEGNAMTSDYQRGARAMRDMIVAEMRKQKFTLTAAFICALPLPADPASSEGANEAREPYQARADKWLRACFGTEIARDKIERNHRFIEEALELVQACGCTQSEAHQIVNYVYARPTGEIGQEIGGVMNTLAALCCAHDFDMDVEADREIERCWGKLEKIRAKQAAKPKHSPLPAHIATDPRDAELAGAEAKFRVTKRALDARDAEIAALRAALEKKGTP